VTSAVQLSHSQRLRAKIKLAMPELGVAHQAISGHPRLADVFPEYLFATHCMIRASVPLMQAALHECRTRSETDAVADAVATYVGRHIREEMHHDDWLLEDLEVLGYDREELLKRTPDAWVAAMVGSQYYWIHHHHPVALLGYIAVMEGSPPTAEQVDALVARTGFPRTAFRTMLRHAQLDPQHRDDLDRAVDDLQLTPDQVSLIGLSALQTIHLGSKAIDSVVARCEAGASS
jgi:hypothetical protein